MSTIKDVAKKAGVAISTVSYAFNNDGRITKATKDKILRVAAELNYAPNASARNLKRKRTNNIGVFIYAFEGPTFPNILHGINVKLQEYGYNIIVSSGTLSNAMLANRLVDAAIVFDNHISDETIINYSAYGPVVVLDRKLAYKNVTMCQIDNYSAVYSFILSMMEKGYDDFGYLSGPLDSFNNIERHQAFLKALSTKELSSVYYQSDFTIKGGYTTGLRFLKQTHPKFIFCSNDELAIGLYQACDELGIIVGKDIFIAGFDNINLCKYIKPGLTTIDVEYSTWGSSVAEYLIKRLNGEVPCPPKCNTRVILRESC